MGIVATGNAEVVSANLLALDSTTMPVLEWVAIVLVVMKMELVREDSNVLNVVKSTMNAIRSEIASFVVMGSVLVYKYLFIYCPETK